MDSLWNGEEPPDPPRPVRWGFQRQVMVPSADSLAEDKVGQRLGWRLPIVRGIAAADHGGGSGAYQCISPSAFLSGPVTPFDVIRVRRWMRFGNSVRQLLNVFHAAETYGARRIEFPGPHDVFAGSESGGIRLVWQQPVQLPPHLANLLPPTKGIEGDFYFVRGLGLAPSAADEERMLVRHLRGLVLPDVNRANDVDDDDLVMHFRGGDIFNTDGSRRVHPAYGQPPVAYYLAAVDRERPRRVWLVHEDRTNPTVDAVEAELRRRGIEVRAQSDTIVADLNVLLNARTLVTSIGTFGPAAAALSTRLRKMYGMWRPPGTLRRLGVHYCEAIDAVGYFDRAVRSHNWGATPEQIALMLHYPREAIVFRDHSPIG